MKKRLVPEAREWWRLWSVRLAGIFAVALAAVADNPAPILHFFGTLAEPWKSLVPLMTLVVTFVVPTLVRLWRQKPADSGDA